MNIVLMGNGVNSERLKERWNILQMDGTEYYDYRNERLISIKCPNASSPNPVLNLALECPNKLYYTRKSEYANQQLEDPFLEALADGGFQVEELARLEYPEGTLIENNDWNYELLIEQTHALLQQENVVIFEAAFKYEKLFSRTDILVRRGNDIKLIEVKAKSFDPDDEQLLVGAREGLKSGWKPYLFDVAFQRYVIQK